MVRVHAAHVDGLMSIGEFSAKCGLSPKRLRMYAAAGLLTPAAVDPDSGYRYYEPDQLADAQLIDTLRRAGIPLAEIEVLLEEGSRDRLDQWARRIDEDAVLKQEALKAARQLMLPETRR